MHAPIELFAWLDVKKCLFFLTWKWMTEQNWRFTMPVWPGRLVHGTLNRGANKNQKDQAQKAKKSKENQTKYHWTKKFSMLKQTLWLLLHQCAALSHKRSRFSSFSNRIFWCFWYLFASRKNICFFPWIWFSGSTYYFLKLIKWCECVNMCACAILTIDRSRMRLLVCSFMVVRLSYNS